MSELGAKLFQDPRAWASDALVEAECARDGTRNRHDIAARKAAARKADAALLAENPGMTVEEYRDLKAAEARPVPVTAARNEELIGLNAAPIYQPAAQVRELVATENSRLKTATPLLDQSLKAGAGSSAPVIRGLLRAAVDRADGGARDASRGSFKPKAGK